MITRKTVLILGAGASYPYGFPLASEMMRLLCQHQLKFNLELHGSVSTPVLGTLHASFNDDTKVKAFREDLLGSALDSIDSFLTARPEYAEIGKAAIAATLIPLERPDNLIPARITGGDWYRFLRNQMGESYENFAESAKNLSVVTFNYDRSIEYYFLNALTSSYGESRALDVLNSMKIVHVYGQLGKPDFLSPGGRSFDPELNRDTVAKCVAEIKVIPENRDGSPEFQEAAKLIESAEVVCFLGFGYNPTNIKRLAIKKHLPNDVVLGSMFGMKQNERRKAWSELTAHITTGILTQNFGEEDEDALLFLREYPVL